MAVPQKKELSSVKKFIRGSTLSCEVCVERRVRPVLKHDAPKSDQDDPMPCRHTQSRPNAFGSRYIDPSQEPVSSTSREVALVQRLHLNNELLERSRRRSFNEKWLMIPQKSCEALSAAGKHVLGSSSTNSLGNTSISGPPVQEKTNDFSTLGGDLRIVQSLSLPSIITCPSKELARKLPEMQRHNAGIRPTTPMESFL